MLSRQKSYLPHILKAKNLYGLEWTSFSFQQKFCYSSLVIHCASNIFGTQIIFEFLDFRQRWWLNLRDIYIELIFYLITIIMVVVLYQIDIPNSKYNKKQPTRLQTKLSLPYINYFFVFKCNYFNYIISVYLVRSKLIYNKQKLQKA